MDKKNASNDCATKPQFKNTNVTLEKQTRKDKEWKHQRTPRD
jgi:hypothetical protein